MPSGQFCWRLGKGQLPAPHLVNRVPLTISDSSFSQTFCCMGVGFWHPEICPALPLSPWIWKGELLRRLGREHPSVREQIPTDPACSATVAPALCNCRVCTRNWFTHLGGAGAPRAHQMAPEDRKGILLFPPSCCYSFQSSPETDCRTIQLAPNHGPTAVDLSPIHSPQMSPRTPLRETQVWFQLCATGFFDIVIAIFISIAPNFDNDRFHSSIFCQRV